MKTGIRIFQICFLMDNIALWKINVLIKEAEHCWQNSKYLASTSEISFCSFDCLLLWPDDFYPSRSCEQDHAAKQLFLKTLGAASKNQFCWFQNLSGICCSVRFWVWDAKEFSKEPCSAEFICPCSSCSGVCVLCLALCAVGCSLVAVWCWQYQSQASFWKSTLVSALYVSWRER